MDERMKAALIGGAAAGVLTIITSIIPILGNFCCFLWALAGGVLAVFLYQKGGGGPMKPADGAMLGVRAGIVAAIIYLVVAVPLTLLWSGAAMIDAAQRSGGSSAAGVGVVAGLGLFVFVVAAGVLVGFNTIGGVIGAALFGKGTGPGMTPPPPPSNYGGTPPSNYGGPGGTTGGPGYGGPGGTGTGGTSYGGPGGA